MRKSHVGAVVVGLLVFVAAGCTKTTTQKSGDKELSVTKPNGVTLKQGANETITISVTRKNFTDAADVKFENLPKGVSVIEAAKDMRIAANTDSAKFTLKAADDADVVSNHEAKVTVSGGGMTNAGVFPVTVQKKS